MKRKANRTMVIISVAALMLGLLAPLAGSKKVNAAGRVQNPNAVLQSMQITFNTLNNDKDDDTRLEVWINKAGEHEAAYLDIQGQKFDDGSVRVYDVLPKSNPMTRGEIPGSWVQLRIAPNGNDTWNFQFRVMLRFNDGSVYERQYGPSTLDQDARQGNYSL